MADNETKAPNVITGTGTAAAGGLKPGEIQDAMTQAIKDIAAETDKIAADPSLPADEKGRQIAALHHPDEVKKRMMQARAGVKKTALDRQHSLKGLPH